MFYYWLVPLLILAVIGIWMFASASKRKGHSATSMQDESPEPIKRGRYMNK